MNARVDELRAAAEELQAELDQLQAVSEGRLDTAISTLRASIDAFRRPRSGPAARPLEAAARSWRTPRRTSRRPGPSRGPWPTRSATSLNSAQNRRKKETT